jgi:hypothetical protein
MLKPATCFRINAVFPASHVSDRAHEFSVWLTRAGSDTLLSNPVSVLPSKRLIAANARAISQASGGSADLFEPFLDAAMPVSESWGSGHVGQRLHIRLKVGPHAVQSGRQVACKLS